MTWNRFAIKILADCFSVHLPCGELLLANVITKTKTLTGWAVCGMVAYHQWQFFCGFVHEHRPCCTITMSWTASRRGWATELETGIGRSSPSRFNFHRQMNSYPPTTSPSSSIPYVVYRPCVSPTAIGLQRSNPRCKTSDNQEAALTPFKSCQVVLQPLGWRCVECAIHHERNACEEKHHIYVARTGNNRVISSGELYCCLLPQCEDLRTCRSGFPIATVVVPLKCDAASHSTNWKPSSYRRRSAAQAIRVNLVERESLIACAAETSQSLRSGFASPRSDRYKRHGGLAVFINFALL